jgi:hypothetical protein
MGRLWVPMADRFNAPSACRVSRDGACDERVQNCPHLDMRPYTTTRRANIALVELRSNSIVAGRTLPHDRIDDRSHIGGKPPRIGAGSRTAALCSLTQVRITQNLSTRLGGLQRGLGPLPAFAWMPPPVFLDVYLEAQLTDFIGDPGLIRTSDLQLRGRCSALFRGFAAFSSCSPSSFHRQVETR